MGYTMENPDDQSSIQEAAREAIDEDKLVEVLELAAGEEVDQDAALALREVAVDTVVADALAATQYARWRGDLPNPEHIGDAAEKRRERCFQPGLNPPHAQWEGS